MYRIFGAIPGLSANVVKWRNLLL